MTTHDTSDRPAAVLFDMDGVLIDSYHAHFESWQVVAARDGITLTEAAFAATFGRTNREIIPQLWNAPDLSAEQIESIADAKEVAFREIVARDWPEMPGIRDVLASLRKAGVRMAVCSSGPPENVQLAVDHFQDVVRGSWDRLFEAAVTSADVTKGKPDPEVFLTGAQKLGVEPAQAVVVEDAVPGVQAAEAAGMRCLVLVSTGHEFSEYANVNAAVYAHSLMEPEVKRFFGLEDE